MGSKEQREWRKKIDALDVLDDLPEGPLDLYRKQASFDWKVMTLIMEKEDTLAFKYRVWRTLENDPVFAHSPVNRTLEEERKVVMDQVLRVQEYDFLKESEGGTADPILVSTLTVALGQYDWSLSARRGILMDFFTNAVRGQGTGKHFDYIEAAYKFQLTGCCALTEIGHGTNTRAFRTKATYDPNSEKFILHTPDFEAAKCWAASLGKTATHAFVMAQLYTPDGYCHGLHSFIIPIRDTKTMLPYPGVMICDMGEKLGLNGLDNGVMTFDHYAVSRDCLLNKNGDVKKDGTYVSQFKDPNKRFGASLGNLSAARTGIVPMCIANMCNALPIAIRYSAVRRQFGSDGHQELPVMEYQMQQWRLFPYLAATYIMKYFGDSFFENFLHFVLSQYSTEMDKDTLALMGTEIHVLSASSKPIAGWLARDAIQECREACGGHGYLRAAGIGRLRDDNDANCTYEGDNNVLLQQTSNWLLSIWANPKREEIAKNMPLGTLTFLVDFNNMFKRKFLPRNVQELMNPLVVLDSYKWLVCWLLQSTAEKFHFAQQGGKDLFTARNDSQVYRARTLSIAFIEHYVLERFWIKMCCNTELPVEIRDVLTKLMLLFGLWSLEKHMATLYQGGYASGPAPANIIREGILELCSSLKNDSVSLADAIAPPDFILNSALGNSDGQVYKHLQLAMSQTPGGFERPSWWQDVSVRINSNL